MCYVCSFVNKKYGEKCGCIFGYFWDEVIKVGVFVFCDDIGVKNVCVCGKMISNVYVDYFIICVCIFDIDVVIGDEDVSFYCFVLRVFKSMIVFVFMFFVGRIIDVVY